MLIMFDTYHLDIASTHIYANITVTVSFNRIAFCLIYISRSIFIEHVGLAKMSLLRTLAAAFSIELSALQVHVPNTGYHQNSYF